MTDFFNSLYDEPEKAIEFVEALTCDITNQIDVLDIHEEYEVILNTIIHACSREEGKNLLAILTGVEVFEDYVDEYVEERS